MSMILALSKVDKQRIRDPRLQKGTALCSVSAGRDRDF